MEATMGMVVAMVMEAVEAVAAMEAVVMLLPRRASAEDGRRGLTHRACRCKIGHSAVPSVCHAACGHRMWYSSVGCCGSSVVMEVV